MPFQNSQLPKSCQTETNTQGRCCIASLLVGIISSNENEAKETIFADADLSCKALMKGLWWEAYILLPPAASK